MDLDAQTRPLAVVPIGEHRSAVAAPVAGSDRPTLPRTAYASNAIFAEAKMTIPPAAVVFSVS
jgi:hypothetical protein